MTSRTPLKPRARTQSTQEEDGVPKVSVRNSIGEWEAGNRFSTPTTSPIPQIDPALTVTKPKKKKVSSQETHSDAVWSPPAQKVYKSRLDEARACLQKAKVNLDSSRNLKTEVKNTVVAVLERLYQIIKEAEMERKEGKKVQSKEKEESIEEGPTSPNDESVRMMREVVQELKEHKKALSQCELSTLALSQKLDNAPTVSHPSTISTPSYACVTARQPVPIRPPLHSIIVSSENVDDTSGNIVDYIRAAVDAKQSGVRVDKLRKVKDQRVVIGCRSKEDIDRVANKLRDSTAKLRVEEALTKDPLVMLSNVLSYNTDDDIIRSIHSQNAHLLRELQPDEVRVAVKFRKRARNQHENHVVLQVSPKVWQRLTEAECIHLDLQRIRVFDQSPLIQCSKCLRFGHGRKLCTEERDLCTHCGGPHLRADCEVRLAGESPNCRNCCLAKNGETGHNAFSGDCPVRKKWDAIARSSVAYC